MTRSGPFLEGLRRLRATGRTIRYTTAVALVVLALALAMSIELMLDRAPTAPLFAAVLAAAWLTGFGPAIAAAAIGVVALDRMSEFSVGAWRLGPRDAFWMLLFFGIVLAMAWLASNIRRLEDERERLLAREREARAAAEAASRAKDDFLAIVSHELRNPLTAILSWIVLLRTGKLDPSEAERATETIHRNTVLQARMIEDLLDVSRAVVGKLDVVLHPVDLAEVVQQAVHSLQPKAQTARVVMETTITPGLHVLGDAARLQQVVVNLVANAIKFTPADGQVQVRLRDGERYVELLVQDTGEGIDPAALPHIFERFYQGPSTLPRRRGLGLGLAIAKYIVELHAGTITADSKGLGRGATFIVRLPIAG